MTLHADWLLPPDLEFTIIDHFMDDKATLASCSLVCSRWLLPSRKYLFQDVTIQLVNHSSLDPIAGFLYIIESSREMNPEWAIRTYIKKLRLEGRPNSRGYDVGTPAASFTLSAIRALLSKLPHLASLYMTKSVILDNASQKPNEKQAQYPRFELDELSIFECTTYSQDPRPLLSLICTFSRIGLLSVDRWGQWRPRPLPVFPPPPFSPPVIRSLAVELVEEVAARALYALLASSPSVVSAYLARISVYVAKWEDIQRLADFANLAGTALRAIELRVQRNVRLDRKLVTCHPIFANGYKSHDILQSYTARPLQLPPPSPHLHFLFHVLMTGPRCLVSRRTTHAKLSTSTRRSSGRTAPPFLGSRTFALRCGPLDGRCLMPLCASYKTSAPALHGRGVRCTRWCPTKQSGAGKCGCRWRMFYVVSVRSSMWSLCCTRHRSLGKPLQRRRRAC